MPFIFQYGLCPVDEFLRGPTPPPRSVIVQANYKDNPWFPRELEEERLHDRATNPDRYGHIWEGDYEPAALGAYYAHQMAQLEREGRITRVPHMAGTPVELWFDLGARKQGRTMAVGFVQRVGFEIHGIDFMEDSGPEHGLPWVAEQLQEKRQTLGYVYGDVVFPHDGGKLQISTGKTIADSWRGLWGSSPVILGRDDIGPGIDEVRKTLPRFYFDRERCERWVDALRNYRAEWDEDDEVYKPHPLADWAAHAADMTRYGCMHTP